jgi:hypothetical protein
MRLILQMPGPDGSVIATGETRHGGSLRSLVLSLAGLA